MGNLVRGTHLREGEAGYNVLLVGTMEDTQRSQPISTENQEIAKLAGLQSYALNRVFACLVSNLVKRIGIEEPYEGNLHVRVCGGSVG